LHINNTIDKITKIKNCLFNFCKNTYGINTRKRQTIYKGLLRPIIAYGAEIWLDHVLKSHINKLESFQYKILRNSIMAFRTTSKSCTACLTNIEPLHTHLKIKQTKFLLIFKNKPLPQNTTLKH